jgi:hypothetical protein
VALGVDAPASLIANANELAEYIADVCFCRSWSSSNLQDGSYIVSGLKPERGGRGHAANLDHEDWST